jgi:hypothetical protein
MIVYLNEIYCTAHVVSIVCKRRHISKHSKKKAKQKSPLFAAARRAGQEGERRVEHTT